MNPGLSEYNQDNASGFRHLILQPGSFHDPTPFPPNRTDLYLETSSHKGKRFSQDKSWGEGQGEPFPKIEKMAKLHGPDGSSTRK